jgi:hypothetical protein
MNLVASTRNQQEEDPSMIVSTDALTKRIRRKLAHHGLQLCINRWPDDNLGRYSLRNASRAVVKPDVNLESLGRELGVLKADERMKS